LEDGARDLMAGPVTPKRPNPARVVAMWDAAPSTMEHIRDGANAVYGFRAGDTRLVLRLTEDRHRSREQLEAELDFIRFVSSRGVATASPVRSADGAWVETLRGDDAPGVWHAVVFTWASGRHFEFFTADVDRPLFLAWGRTMGALHAASREFVPAAGRRRVSWSEQDTVRCEARELPSWESAARREHALLTEWLGSLEATPESWGLIHGDFERTNFKVDGSTLRVYDFDDACYHWYLADIAHALWVFRGAPSSDRRRFLTWFLEGYREHSPAGADVRERLSWFARLRSLSLFAHRLLAEAPGDLSARDARWADRMRAEFEKPLTW
jgi:Ser/Thr protein kinase RdoA (MazF antagonist)